jgi:hypothetical protein
VRHTYKLCTEAFPTALTTLFLSDAYFGEVYLCHAQCPDMIEVSAMFYDEVLAMERRRW